MTHYCSACDAYRFVPHEPPALSVSSALVGKSFDITPSPEIVTFTYSSKWLDAMLKGAKGFCDGVSTPSDGKFSPHVLRIDARAMFVYDDDSLRSLVALMRAASETYVLTTVEAFKTNVPILLAATKTLCAEHNFYIYYDLILRASDTPDDVRAMIAASGGLDSVRIRDVLDPRASIPVAKMLAEIISNEAREDGDCEGMAGCFLEELRKHPCPVHTREFCGAVLVGCGLAPTTQLRCPN